MTRKKNNKQKFILDKNAHLIDEHDKSYCCNNNIDYLLYEKEKKELDNNIIILLDVFEYIEKKIPETCFQLINEFIGENIIDKYSYIIDSENIYNKSECNCIDCKNYRFDNFSLDEWDYFDDFIDDYQNLEND
jgi:hypothetical protein